MRYFLIVSLVVLSLVQVFSVSHAYAAKKISDFKVPSSTLHFKEYLVKVVSSKEKENKITRKEDVILFDEANSEYFCYRKWVIITKQDDLQFTEFFYYELPADSTKLECEYTIINATILTKKGKPFISVINISEDEAEKLKETCKEHKRGGWSIFLGL